MVAIVAGMWWDVCKAVPCSLWKKAAFCRVELVSGTLGRWLAISDTAIVRLPLSDENRSDFNG